MNTKKRLVAYFSCTGTTARVAENIAKTTDADLFEIKPLKPYTREDIDWRDRNSRSTKEMKDEKSRPLIGNRVENMEDYDVVFLGFPIWWEVAPRIIETFLESYDFSGKTIVPFFTSGGSGAGRTDSVLRKLCPQARFLSSLHLQPFVTVDALRKEFSDLDI